MWLLSFVCVIRAYLPNDFCDRWCDKGLNASAYLIARSMHDCLSRTRVVAPMTPRITQTTSYQRDALYWRGAEILAPHRQPGTGPAFITTLPVPFPLPDGVICGWVEQVSTVPEEGYRRPWLRFTQDTISSTSLVFTFNHFEHCHLPKEHWGVQFRQLKSLPSRRILIWFRAQFPGDTCSHSFCWSIGLKAGSPGVLCCGGKQRCYPNRDLSCMDFGQQESQQEGLSHEIPWTGCYCIITLPLYLTRRKQILSFLIVGGGNLTHIYLIPSVDCLQKQQWLISLHHMSRYRDTLCKHIKAESFPHTTMMLEAPWHIRKLWQTLGPARKENANGKQRGTSCVSL